MKTLEDQLTEKVSAFDALAAEHAKLTEAVASLTAEVESHKAIAAAAQKEITELCEALDKAKAESDALKAEAESAAKKAAAIVAQAGVPAVAATPAKTVSKDDVRAEYMALMRTNPKAAADFFAKNRASL